MDNRDLTNIGDQIRRSVEDAMSSMDFEQLNRNISDTVGSALEEARKNLVKAASSTGMPIGSGPGEGNASKGSQAGEKNASKDSGSGADRSSHQPFKAQYEREQQRPNGPGYQPFSSYKRSSTAAVRPDSEATAVRVNSPSKMPGILYTVFGGIGLGVSSVLLLMILLLCTVVPSNGFLIGMLMMLGCLVGAFGVMLSVGNSKRGLIRRLKTYLSEVGARTYCTVEELARVAGKPCSFVAKDLQKMITRGILPDAHMDKQKTCVMLDYQTYQQYLEAQQGYQERKRLESQSAGKRKADQKESTPLVPKNTEEQDELQKMVAAGREYVNMLREANDAIPGEQISQKLTKLEHVISRIFETVEKHPDQMKEMERFMDYYLPTTVKLVNAYRDFDSVETAGNNVVSAKQEIENTLDTINQAFEQLLDDLYQDAALDASTDASVLQTILKSEGFTDSDFRRKNDE